MTWTPKEISHVLPRVNILLILIYLWECTCVCVCVWTAIIVGKDKMHMRKRTDGTWHEKGKETRQGQNNAPGIVVGKEDTGKENC